LATLELISERGIDALRGADVADRLGVSPALFSTTSKTWRT